MKKTLALFLISINLYAAVPEKGQPAPEPNYTKMMPMESEEIQKKVWLEMTI